MVKINKIKIIFIFFIISIFQHSASAAKLFNESYYQTEWCNKWNGRSEVKLSDNTRVDCITKNYATEFDFAPKWAEAIGQSLHYSKMTGKNPAIILIIEKPSDFKYYKRVKPIAEEHGIKLWYMKGIFYNSDGRALLNLLNAYREHYDK